MTVAALLLATIASGPLTIDAAVDEALAASPELRAAGYALTSAETKVDAARSASLPRISFDAMYLARAPRNELPIDLPPIPGLPPVGDVDDVHHVNADLRLGYRIFDLSRGPRAEAAEHAAAAVAHQRDVAAAELAFGVRASFLAALFSRDVEQIAQASLELARADEKRMSARQEAGVESKVALAQARVRVAELEAQLEKAKSERVRYTEQLRILLGRDDAPALTGDLTKLARGSVETNENHPKVLALVGQQRAAMSMEKSKARGIIPTVDLFATIGIAYPRALQLELGPVYQAGVKLQWAAFDGFLRDAETRGFEADAARAGALADAAKREVHRQSADLSSRAEVAKAALTSAEKTHEQTEIYLQVAKTALATGTGTQLDVHTAELGLDRTRIAMKRAELDLALVHAEALRVHGRTTETNR